MQKNKKRSGSRQTRKAVPQPMEAQTLPLATFECSNRGPPPNDFADIPRKIPLYHWDLVIIGCLNLFIKWFAGGVAVVGGGGRSCRQVKESMVINAFLFNAVCLFPGNRYPKGEMRRRMSCIRQ